MSDEKIIKERNEFIRMCREFSQEHGVSVREHILKKLKGVPRNATPHKRDKNDVVWARKTLLGSKVA